MLSRPRLPVRAVRAFCSFGLVAAVLVGGVAHASISVTTAPNSAISGWALASTGTNTVSGGSIAVASTGPYTVAVTADVTRMSEWNGTAYVTGGAKLTTALSVIPTRTGGNATVPATGTTAVIGTSSALVTGTGSLSGVSDSFSITLSQPTSMADAALRPGRSYHIVLTYTTSATI